MVAISLAGGGKAGGSGVARPRCRWRDGPATTAVLSERGRALRRGEAVEPVRSVELGIQKFFFSDWRRKFKHLTA